MLGGGISGTEMEYTYFSDFQMPNTTHFVEWKTVSPVVVNHIRLFAAGDGPDYLNEREFASFNLLAKVNGSYVLVYTYTPTHPYTFVDPANLMVLDVDVSPLSAQEFRAEFIQYTSGRGYDGPRIVELDAFGSVVEVPRIKPSNNDLWDVSQGTMVTGCSPLSEVAMTSANNMFGDGQPGTEGEYTYFSDLQPEGTVHFVEWQTLSPVMVNHFRLFAAGDGPANLNQREFAAFDLKAKVNGEFQTIYTYAPGHPYSFIDDLNLLVVDADLTPVVASEFRAEFVQYTSGRGYDGPRIVELDAFGATLPSSNDKFDVNSGVSVLKHSKMQPGSSIRNMFGDTIARDDENGLCIFRDNQSAGAIHYVEFKTKAPVTLNAIRLFAKADDASTMEQREFARFTLKSRLDNQSEYAEVCSFVPTHPYTMLDDASYLIMHQSITPVTGQMFRAEFEQMPGANGPLVIELDAFGQ